MLTRRLRQIRNARHFQFESALVFTAQWFRFGGSVAHYLTRRYVLFCQLELYILLYSSQIFYFVMHLPFVCLINVRDFQLIIKE